MHLSLIEMFALMGPFAKAIVVLLVVMSLVSFATALERLSVLRSTARNPDRFVPAWRAVLAAKLPPEERREAYDRAVRSNLVATGAALRRGFAVIATVGATAPFVGLVGTVLGIVNAFQQLSASGEGGIGEVSAGIAEALVTTAVGIGVAIPAVWLFNHLSQRTTRLLADLECRAQDLAVTTLTEGR